MRSIGLLPMFSLLFLSTVSVGQDHVTTAAGPNPCPVTTPAERPFVPPAPHPATPGGGAFWFGTGRLWTVLPETGIWSGLPHSTPSDPTFRQKLAFWREGYDPHTEPQPNLTVSGRRIDSNAPPLQTDGRGNGSWTDDDEFIMTGINFPTTGCWEITGRFDDDELTFVVWVAPSVPPSCQVTVRPTDGFTPPAPYEVDPNAFWWGTEKLWTFVGEPAIWGWEPHKPGHEQEVQPLTNKLFWMSINYDWRAETDPELTVTGRRLDGTAPPLLVTPTHNAFPGPGAAMIAGVYVPTPGCWEITGNYKGENLSFVVWVEQP